MPRLLESLENFGKAVGWLGSIASASVAIAAFMVAWNSFELNRTNLKYQRVNSSLLLMHNVLRDLLSPGQRNGGPCMQMILNLPTEYRSLWASHHALDYVDLTDSTVQHCFFDLGAEDQKIKEKREIYVFREIYAGLNILFVAIQAINTNQMDTDIMCDSLNGVLNDPTFVEYFQTVIVGSPQAKSWALVQRFLNERRCHWQT